MTRDALCGVTAEGPLATKLASGCCPRAGGLGHGQGCRGSTVCFVRLCPARSAPETARGPLPHPIAGALLLWTSSLGHHDVSLEKGMCSQEKYTWERCIVPSLQSFDGVHCKGTDDESVCNYSNILLVSSHTGTMSQTCHRGSLGGGNLFY